MKISKYIFALLFFLAATLSAALPVPVKRSTDPNIIDQAQVLSAQDETHLLAFLRAYHQKAGVTMDIITVKSLEGEEVFSFGMRIIEDWKAKGLSAGDKETDRGLLYVFALKERKTHLFTGQGMEGEITDGIAGEIQRSLTPFYKSRDYGNGMIDLVRSCAKASGIANLQAKGVPKARARKKPSSGKNIGIIILIILIVLGKFIFPGRGGGMIFLGGSGGHWGGGSGGGGFGGGGFGGGGGGFSGGGAGGSW